MCLDQLDVESAACVWTNWMLRVHSSMPHSMDVYTPSTCYEYPTWSEVVEVPVWSYTISTSLEHTFA